MGRMGRSVVSREMFVQRPHLIVLLPASIARVASGGSWFFGCRKRCLLLAWVPSLVQRGAIQTALTPFRDDILNRRRVSVYDRGSFPHDPETVRDRTS